jgi:outer membrane autotransporter protein
MSVFPIKKALLTGTAVVAVSFCIANAAFAQTVTPVMDATFNAPVTGSVGSNGATNTNGVDGGSGTEAVNTGAANLTLINNAALQGGAGGLGGDSTGINEPGAAGGAAGAGVVINQATTRFNNTTTGTVVGGAGGNGGAGTNGDANGGAGATGGNAIDISANVTIFNSGTIQGGDAGNSGAASGAGTESDAASGGHGINITGGTIVLTNNASGQIRGGAGGTGNLTGAEGDAVRTTAAGATINNAGLIDSTTGVAVHAAAGGTNTRIVNGVTGIIDTTSGTAVQLSVASAGSTLSNAGNITADSGTAVNVEASMGAQGLVNTGTISSVSGTAVNIAPGVSTTLFSNTGTIRSTSGSALVVAGTLGTVTNIGTLTSSGTNGTMVLAGDQAGLTLNGTITNTNATTAGTALQVNVAQSSPIINTGTITANGGGTALGTAVAFNGVAGTFDNRGTVSGRIVGTAGAQTFINTLGTTTGTIDLGDGNNVVTFTAGTVTGDVTTGVNDDTINFNGGTHVGAVELGAGDNTVNINENKVLTTALNSTGGSSTVNIAVGKTFTTNAAMTNLGGVTVNTGAIFNHNTTNTVGTTGALTNNGRINIAAGQTLNVANQAAGTGVYGFQYGATGTAPGSLTVANGDLDFTGSSIVFSLDPNATALPITTPVVFASAPTGLVTLPGASSITDTSLLYDFVTAGTGTTAATVTATRVGGGAVSFTGGNTNNAAVAAVFDANVASVNPEISATQMRLAAASTTEQINDILEATLPTVDSSASAASATVTNQASSLTNARLAGLRAARSGTATGDAASEHRVWAQPFATTVDQDDRDNVRGYKSNTYGVTVGADTDALAKNTIIGVAATYGNTNADSDNANQTESDIDSYQVQVYGDYNLGNRAFVDASVGYGFNSVDRTRNDVGGTPGLTATANYDSSQFFASTGVGKTYTPIGGHEDIEITPRVGVRYTHLSTDSFTETGAGGLNLAIDTDNAQALEVGIGTEIAYSVPMEHGIVTPSVHVGYTYDVIGDAIQTSSSFAGGGASFATQGSDPEQGTLNAGAGVTYYSNNNLDLSVNYDAQIKADYIAHAGYLKALRKF